jgi:transposase
LPQGVPREDSLCRGGGRLSPDLRIKELEELVVRLIAERDAAIQRQQELEKENIELKKRLVFYENPHTPPSQRTLKKKEKSTGEKKKRGAPKGHRGATRVVPPPEEVVDVSAAQCPECHRHPGDPVAMDTHVVEDILPPRVQRVKVTQYDLHDYKCQHCGHEFSTKHERCPQVGNIGPSLTVYTTMLKYHLRGPIRKVQGFLAQYSGFVISPKGVHDILLRVAEACRSEYERTLERVRAARWVYIDETHFDVLGKRHWLWIFRTDGGDVLVVIRPSRGRKVLKEILGEDFAGAVIADGWKPYWYIRILQRCWSHLIREVDDFKDASDNGRRLSEEIHAMFKDLKESLISDPPMEERKRRKDELDAGMVSLVERYSASEELEKPETYLRNGLGHWYTCLLYPGMEPTNNLGEQAMREHVIMRKIIGCFRSENGSQAYQYIASLLATWKLQDKNMFEELEKLVVREICLR